MITLAVIIIMGSQVQGQNFRTRQTEIVTDTAVISVAYFHQQYFCLQENGVMLRIDTTDKVHMQPTTVHTLKKLHVYRDTLFGVSESNSLYYFNGIDFKHTRSRFYELPLYADAEYEVTATCSGEWGGSVYFTNKKTGVKYTCSATCPVMINKKDSSYIVTASLAHLTGSTEILKINSPEQLKIYDYKRPKKGEVIYVGSNESSSRQGAVVLADSTGLFTIASFPFQEEILHIVTDFRSTFLCKIRDGRFMIMQQLADKSYWSYYPTSWYNEGDGLFCFFINHEENGFIRIVGEEISAYVFKKGNGRK